jgi:hypothetical protein
MGKSMNKKNFPPHIVDGGASYQKKVEEAPYHPGYEDAVVTPASKYTGMDPAKMLWKPKPLSDKEINEIFVKNFPAMDREGEVGEAFKFILICCIRDAEERHGINGHQSKNC